MEIRVQRNDLAKELQLVQGIVERKSSIPILQNVLCEARAGEIRIAATDLDVSLRCGCAAEVIEEGSVTLAAKKLYEIVRSLPGNDVRVKLESDAWARIQCERVEFRMAGLPREDFPSLPEPKGARGDRAAGAAAARAGPAHRLRDHRRGRALLPGGGAARARQGRGGDGRDGRPPARVGRAQDDAQAGRRRARAGAAQGDHRARAPDRGGGRRRDGLVPAGRRSPDLRHRRPDARLEAGRGAVPGLREGDRA